MDVFCSILATETNSFSNIPTEIANFEQFGIVRSFTPDVSPTFLDQFTGLIKQQVEAKGHRLHFGLAAFAEPAGPVTRTTYDRLKGELISSLKNAMPLDIVFLGLHGAMIADGTGDCEGDILDNVRKIVGPDTVIGAVMDPHAHLTAKMTAKADILVFYKEYPHTDIIERTREALDLCLRSASGDINPVISVHDCRMLRLWPTQDQPIRGFVDKMKRLEVEEEILSISFVHGFPWGDVADIGTKLMVITDNRPEKGKGLAAELGKKAWDMRNEANDRFMTLDDAMDSIHQTIDGPIVLADVSDNPGGGAPGDATHILRYLLDRKVTNAVFSPICDPGAVKLCFAAGKGARLDLRIGGKTGWFSGLPVDINMEIKKLNRDVWQTFPGNDNMRFPIGDTVWVSGSGLDIILSTVRSQCYSLEAFVNSGVDPLSKRIIVVKSANHFYTAFAPTAKKVLFIATPGTTNPDIQQIPYKQLNRPVWPLSQNPHG
ncbi:MAG: M81 family metallopeptidase [Desulfobacteraceae bacterium]|nr:M81 family metallopeptidase [Desulfobacteraceae bacterium]